ncbi:MAG TPA: hypothetical protein VIM29_02800 [Bacillota bacterium]
MKVVPEYAKNIIVGVVYKGLFSWYVTEKEFWILDAEKRRNEYINNGYAHILPENYFDFRFNIPILNEKTAELFLGKIADLKVDTDVLRALILNRKYNTTVLELAPSLFVDFDKKRLYSIFPESLSFEKYVPKGWIGEFRDFYKYIPKEDTYWIDGSIDYLNKIFSEEITP